MQLRYCLENTMPKLKNNHLWIMPEWMEPYRELISNVGSTSIEDLMNDRFTTSFTNPLRFSMIIAVKSQVQLLNKLHEKGILDD